MKSSEEVAPPMEACAFQAEKPPVLGDGSGPSVACCESEERDDEAEAASAIITEMAALGLPHNFVARQESALRKSKKRQSSKTGAKDHRALEAAEVGRVSNFTRRSVRLYSENVEPLGLDRAAEARPATASVDDGMETLLPLNADVSGVEASGGSPWAPIWDDKYQRYYFSNSQTSESTWDIPPGFTCSVESVAGPSDLGSAQAHFSAKSSLGSGSPADGLQESPLGLGMEIHREKPSAGDDEGGSPPNADLCHPRDEMEEDLSKGVGDSGAGEAKASEGPSWVPAWDDQYQRYYFCNSKTSESTWEPPPGFERFSSCSLTGLDAVPSSLPGQENQLSAVEDGRLPVEQVGGEEKPLYTLLSVQAAAVVPIYEVNCGEVLSVEVPQTDQDGKIEDGDNVPKLSNSHIRFSDSEESSEMKGGISWDESQDENSPLVVKRDFVEQEEAFGSSLRLLPPNPFVLENGLKDASDGMKKRRLRSLSGSSTLVKSLQPGNEFLPGTVEVLSQSVLKYWVQRYKLFAKYDQGVKMDEEGWFSVTPETIAKHQASRCATGVVIDAFTGVGGNAIQFARRCSQVIAIDIDPQRVEYARHNAEIYGVANKIEFIVGDFFQLAPSLKADFLFLSPPWGGPEYLKQDVYDLHTMLQPKDGCTLFKAAQSIAPNIVLFVPRNVDLNQLEELSWLTSPPLPCEVEENFVDNKLKAITAYYGDMAGQYC